MSLSQAIAIALADNPQPRGAAAQLAGARAAIGVAEAARRFQITFDSVGSVSSGDVYQPPPSHESFTALQNSLTVPLPIGPRAGLITTQAREQLTATRYQVGAMRLALVGQVVDAYYGLLQNRALLDAADQTLVQARQQLTDTQARNRAGDVAELDVLQAQVPVAAAVASVDQATTTAAASQETLNDLMNRPLDAAMDVVDPGAPPAQLPFTLEQARDIAAARSATVAAAAASVQADRAAVGAARLYRQPLVSLQAIDLRSRDLTSFSREDTVQADVSVPIADGGAGRSATLEAQAILAQAQTALAIAKKSASLSASQAYLTAQSSGSQLAAALTSRNVAQTTYDKTVEGYRNGLFPLVNVLTAQNALEQAKIAYIQSLYGAESAWRTLSIAVGGVAGDVSTPDAGLGASVLGGAGVPAPAAARGREMNR